MTGTRRKPGRMGPHIEGFQARLLELGYTPGTVRGLLKEAGGLGRWMASQDIQTARLSEGAVGTFLAGRQASMHGRVPSVRSFAPLLEYLRNLALVPPVTAAPPTPVDELVADYETWLVVDRGLAAPTVLRYENLARRFLCEQAAAFGVGFVDELTGAEVVGFLVRECSRLSVGAAKGRVGELRSLLRFLYLKGLTPLALATAVPPVAGWHDTGVPTGIAASDVERLLDGCDKNDSGGIRDFAILMLVARLGLRSAEVARLELGDIDWRAGEIVVRGKARRRDRLPLPSDVGEALSEYLCEARRATPIRRVFPGLQGAHSGHPARSGQRRHASGL